MNASHVAFGKLYQGALPPEGDALRRAGFDLLVLCAEEYQPDASMFPGVRVIHAPFEDHPIDKQELRVALAASEELARRLSNDFEERVDRKHEGVVPSRGP